MNLLQFFFIISGIIIFIIWLDIAKKQRFNALHFLVFLWVWAWLLVFTFFPNILQSIWNIFGVARWADVLVYASIIFLLYFVLLLLTKHVEDKEDITKIVREFAIEKSEKKIIEWEEVLLIRAYNEGEVIEWVIEEVLKKWYKNILLINDGSDDNTKNILEKFWKKIILLNHFANRWAWAALETGFEYLRRYGKVKYIITFDADWQHRLKDVSKMLEKIKENKNVDVIFGSRFIWKKDSNIPFFRKITLFLGRIFTFFVSSVFLTDAHNWLRIFKYKVIKKINLEIDSMAYASEFIDKLNKNNFKIEEIPVKIKYTDYSLKKWQKSWNAINIALRILWSKFFR